RSCILPLLLSGHVVISASDRQGPSAVKSNVERAYACIPDATNLVGWGLNLLWENSMRRILTVLAALASLSLTNCGYNAIQSQDEQVKSSWSEVVNQYQRRADLIPNLVNSIKGFAQQEKDVLLGVTNARAKVGTVQEYNVTIRSFPTNLTAMMFGYKEKPNFSVENEKEISTAPKVDFNPVPATPAPAK